MVYPSYPVACNSRCNHWTCFSPKCAFWYSRHSRTCSTDCMTCTHFFTPWCISLVKKGKLTYIEWFYLAKTPPTIWGLNLLKYICISNFKRCVYCPLMYKFSRLQWCTVLRWIGAMWVNRNQHKDKNHCWAWQHLVHGLIRKRKTAQMKE